MVYKQAARKTAGFMAVALVASFAIVTFLAGDFGTPTGRVTSEGTQPLQIDGLIIFLLGVFVGLLALGTYVYIAHIEAKREE